MNLFSLYLTISSIFLQETKQDITLPLLVERASEVVPFPDMRLFNYKDANHRNNRDLQWYVPQMNI